MKLLFLFSDNHGKITILEKECPSISCFVIFNFKKKRKIIMKLPCINNAQAKMNK